MVTVPRQPSPLTPLLLGFAVGFASFAGLAVEDLVTAPLLAGPWGLLDPDAELQERRGEALDDVRELAFGLRPILRALQRLVGLHDVQFFEELFHVAGPPVAVVVILGEFVEHA